MSRHHRLPQKPISSSISSIHLFSSTVYFSPKLPPASIENRSPTRNPYDSLPHSLETLRERGLAAWSRPKNPRRRATPEQSPNTTSRRTKPWSHVQKMVAYVRETVGPPRPVHRSTSRAHERHEFAHPHDEPTALPRLRACNVNPNARASPITLCTNN